MPQTPKMLAYSVLDVFAERPLEGNPLAVFHDARGLDDETLQALARETNLSETTFALPSDDAEEDLRHGVRVRIFTTREELRFAGHPTLGTAAWLRLHHPAFQGAETVTLRLKGGDIPVRFNMGQSTGDGGLYGTMRQADPVFGEQTDRAETAKVLGLAEGDLLAGFQPQVVSTGNGFCIVPLASPEVLGRLAIPYPGALGWLQAHQARWFYCIAPTEHPLQWRARMQWTAGEDPATGSAAGPCIAWMVRAGLVGSGVAATLLQGNEILRPSRIAVQATSVDGVIRGVEVGGRTIPVAAGNFLLPL